MRQSLRVPLMGLVSAIAMCMTLIFAPLSATGATFATSAILEPGGLDAVSFIEALPAEVRADLGLDEVLEPSPSSAEQLANFIYFIVANSDSDVFFDNFGAIPNGGDTLHTVNSVPAESGGLGAGKETYRTATNSDDMIDMLKNGAGAGVRLLL